MISANSYENCFDSLAGTPSKKRNSTALAPSSARTPASSAKRNQRGDRFIPQRSAMDLDVSHFELTRATDSENNANVNASPAKEECALLAPTPKAGGTPERATLRRGSPALRVRPLRPQTTASSRRL